MPAPRILVTGFGPFPGVKVNPTDRLMRLVVAGLARRGAVRAEGARLDVSYARARRQLNDRMEASGPDAVLLLGLAARARWVRVERLARRSDSPLHPDASGRGGSGPQRDSALPLRATAALEPALAAFRRLGLRARLSPSAGRYLCNAVYAEALGQAAGRPVLFVHVPWPSGHHGPAPRGRAALWRPGVAALTRALIDLASGLAAQARRARTGQSRLA